MLNMIKRFACFSSEVCESGPYQKGAGDVIALDAGFAALAFFEAGELFGFAVKLLDLPAPATHLVRAQCGILRQVVGDNKIRAVGRHHNPEQFHLMRFWKILDLDRLAHGKFLYVPI